MVSLIDIGSGLTSKLGNAVYNNGEIIGVAAGTFAFGTKVIDNFMQLPQWGFPRVDVVIDHMVNPNEAAGKLNWEMAGLWIGGYALKEMGLAGKVGGLLQKFAKGFVIGNLIQDVANDALTAHY